MLFAPVNNAVRAFLLRSTWLPPSRENAGQRLSGHGMEEQPVKMARSDNRGGGGGASASWTSVPVNEGVSRSQCSSEVAGVGKDGANPIKRIMQAVELPRAS